MKKHIYFIIACLTALNVSFSYAAQAAGIHDDTSCPAFDFRDRFGSTQNQGFHQICWAMAGTSLIEEEACLMDPQFCGINFSAVDIGSCDPRLGHVQEENVVERAINCAKIRGVCPSHLAPFVDFRVKQSLLSKLTMDKRFQRSQIFHLFDQYKVSQRNRSAAEQLKQQTIQNEFLQEFRQIFPANDFSDRKLIQILHSSKDVVELLDRTLISDACENNRVKFTGIDSTFTRIFPDLNPRILSYYSKDEIREFTLPVSTQLEVIVERFKNGRSLALSICPEKFSFIEDMMIPGGDCISGHAIIANAIRRNTKTGSCEVHLMDSRKESSTIQFNGWFDLKTVANATIAITQIIPKKDQ